MTRGDDLEKAKRMMREAVEEYRKELDDEENKRKKENPFGINPSNRVETIAHAKWVCELRLRGRTEKEIDKYLGDYVKERAVKRGETNTTVIKRGDHWKVLVKYLKN